MIFGITGWSGSGKTSLIERLLPELAKRGFIVAVLKHAHHSFEIDQEGKDSWRLRQAGCRQMAVSSSRRWALLHEIAADEEEADVFALCGRFDSCCNLILVEGYKNAPLPKLEVWRQTTAAKPLAFNNPHIVAVATDSDVPPPLPCPLLPLNDTGVVADFIAARAAKEARAE